jgi:hypothetical protein
MVCPGPVLLEMADGCLSGTLLACLYMEEGTGLDNLVKSLLMIKGSLPEKAREDPGLSLI